MKDLFVKMNIGGVCEKTIVYSSIWVNFEAINNNSITTKHNNNNLNLDSFEIRSHI